MKQVLASVILALLMSIPVASSADTYQVGKTRTHECKTFVCGKAKEVEVSRIYLPDGETKTLRVYKNGKGKIVRIIIE